MECRNEFFGLGSGRTHRAPDSPPGGGLSSRHTACRQPIVNDDLIDEDALLTKEDVAAKAKEGRAPVPQRSPRRGGGVDEMQQA